MSHRRLERETLFEDEMKLFRGPGTEGAEDEVDPETLPQLYTARYFAEDVLSQDGIVPVCFSMDDPITPIPYDLESSPKLILPERSMVGEWYNYSPKYWRKLERLGLNAVVDELNKIADRHDRLPLALLQYEDVTRARGHKSTRLTFALWFETKTGVVVPELTNDGEALTMEQLHRQVMPKLPKRGT